MPSSPTPTWAPELLARAYYSDDSVVLIHGDCLEHSEWWTGADVLVTDPPYGVRWTGIATSYDSHNRRVARRQPDIAGDGDTDVRDEALAIWGSRPAAIFGSWKAPSPEGVAHRLIWDKRGMAPGPVNGAFMTMDEEIYILGKGWLRTAPPERSVISTSESRSQEVQQIGHPTPKPIGLMERILRRCPPGVIADPFAGSGSTLVAAKLLGRKAVGVELEEKYCEIAARRLSQGVLDFGDWKGNA